MALETLRRKRGSIQGGITTLEKLVKTWEEDEQARDAYHLPTTLDGITQRFSKFEKIQEDIEALDETEADNRDAIYESFYLATTKAKRLLEASVHNIHMPRPSIARDSSNHNIIELPRIHLPKFDGSHEKWSSFYNSFSALIDRRDDLTQPCKLQYLQMALSGPAASLVESLEITDGNYYHALQLLKDRFACTRVTLWRHWDEILAYPRLQRDTPSAIRAMLDKITQHVRSLQSLGIDTKQWDIPLTRVVMTKVSVATANAWQISMSNDTMPSLEGLIEFLEKRANCAGMPNNKSVTGSMGSDSGIPTKPQRPGYSQSFVTTVKQSRPSCLESHRLHQCAKYKGMSVDDRDKFASSSKLCYNCLSGGHILKNCKSTMNCGICDKRHHTLLYRTFVGANNHLKDLMSVSKTEDCQGKVQDLLSRKGIEWHFSPPRSPHFGGLWEAAVKAFKIHLIKVASVDLLFTFEEFNTLITEIEFILNSRPLTPLSNDPNDLLVLTPSHFLIGECLTSLRDRDYSSIPSKRLSVWNHLQKIKEHFWSRWKRDYLNELACRHRWAKGAHQINVNTMVLLKEDNIPHNLDRGLKGYPS